MEIKDYHFNYYYYGEHKKKRWWVDLLIDLGKNLDVVSISLYKEELEKLIEDLQHVCKEMP